MTDSLLPTVRAGDRSVLPTEIEDRPPGERYFRHPGDVVRLVVWATAVVTLAITLGIASSTTDGLTADFGRIADRLPLALRELAFALAQLAAIGAPLIVVLALLRRSRWRRLGVVVLAAAAGAALFALLESLLDVAGRLPAAVSDGTWVASTTFPSPVYGAGAAATFAVAKPWLSRSWRRASDLGLAALLATMALAGTAGVMELLIALATGMTTGAALLVLFGAPNRRPTPFAVATGLRDAGLDVSALTLERAEGGRSQLYLADLSDGRKRFVKVYGQDSRDGDLLYRGYRKLLLREPQDDRPSLSLAHDVEHQALLLMLAARGGLAVPEVEALTTLRDSSVALALEYLDGLPLDRLDPDQIDSAMLDEVWRQVTIMQRVRLATRSLRARNILVVSGAPVLIDFGFGEESASPRLLAIDRAELLASLATLVGVEAAAASAARTIAPADLAASIAYLQPLALSAATRKEVSKSTLKDLRAELASLTGAEPPSLERLIRVRPRTVLTIAALAGAFYVLLPQLASVDDSFRALRSASFGWLGVCVLMSGITYIASAVGLVGGVPRPLPFLPTVEAQVASSFVNRVTPANVGGMALNVRFMQKMGVDPAQAVTGMGLNVIAGAVVHLVLLFVFVAWAGQGGGSSFKIPGQSKVLVAIVVLLVLAGIVLATRRGRRLFRTRILRYLKESWASLSALARSPGRLVALFGGSAGVTLAYIGALAAAVIAVHGHLSFAQVGAVYLGASIVAAAAPTPGGLGAMEAALAAGLAGVGMEPGLAVAAVLSYRLMTFWLPILPGWMAYHVLERHNFI